MIDIEDVFKTNCPETSCKTTKMDWLIVLEVDTLTFKLEEPSNEKSLSSSSYNEK